MTSQTFRAAPSLRAIRKSDGELLLKTDANSVVLNGASAELFEFEILPLLDGTWTTEEIAKQVGLNGSVSLSELLGELNAVGVLLTGESGQSSAFLEFVEMLGLDREEAERRLKDLSVAVIGQGHLGQMISEQLSSLPLSKLSAVSESGREGLDVFSEAHLGEVAKSHDFLVSTLGGSFPAVDHRVNRAAHRHGVSVLYCSVGQGRSTVGPMVFPYETACFTCYKMRAAACVDSFADHMAFEEAASQSEVAVNSPAAEVGFLVQIVAGTAVTELLKSVLAYGQTHPVDKVLEFEPFKTGWIPHHLLRRHDCPTCSKKNFQTNPI